jgi:hypothetical protein
MIEHRTVMMIIITILSSHSSDLWGGAGGGRRGGGVLLGEHGEYHRVMLPLIILEMDKGRAEELWGYDDDF